MKLFHCAALTCGVLLLAGCERDDSPNLAPLPLDQLPAAVEQSFQKADPELRADASNAIGDVQKSDLSAAFQDFTELNSKGSLSLKQHTLLARALMTLSQQLTDAADRGDEQAAETLRHHLATK
ncbi:MAG: hypothetical protein ACLQVY_02490 [Limisphaerales bacterium]